MKSQIRWGTFLKISLVVIVSIFLTNAWTIISSVYITKHVFVESSTFINRKLMDIIMKNVEEKHVAYQTLIRKLETDPSLKNYCLVDDPNSVAAFTLVYDILKVYQTHLEPDILPNLVTISNGGRMFSFTGERLVVPWSQIKELPCSKRVSEDSRRLQYTYQPSGITEKFENQPCVVAARNMFLLSSNQSFATAYITISEADFYEMFCEAIPDYSHMFILSSDGQIVSGNDKSILGEFDPILLSHAKELHKSGEMYRNVNHGRNSDILISQYIEELDMYMVNVVDEAALLEAYGGIWHKILMTGFFITGTAITVVFLLLRRIAAPLNFFIQQLDSFRNRRFEKVYLDKGGVEVKQMAEVYNCMVDEIHSYVGRLIKEQERSRKLEIEALQMQIKPHFMYNTLASIKYLAWQNNTEQVSDTIHALIAILRKTIGDLDEEILLSEEVDLTRKYVDINSIRYGGDIMVEYFIADDCIDCMVPKLILQPFIENAFFHAFQNKKRGMIRMFARKQREELVLEIIDEGDGMTQETVTNLLNQDCHRHLTGIGIPNVQERIKLMYGEIYGVSICSMAGIGTSVTIRVPFHLKNTKTIKKYQINN